LAAICGYRLGARACNARRYVTAPDRIRGQDQKLVNTVNLLLRFLLVLLRATCRSRLAPLDTSVIRLRVWLTDLDVFMHMNNGRYLSLMDLGRIDFLVRIGFWREARRRRWYPIVRSGLINYRRPLTLFESYELRTKLIGWDERWFYMEQQFIRNGVIAAAATMKTMIRNAAGAISTADALAALGYFQPSPALPDHIAVLARKDRHKELL
jgi:acyl-CoA thioesterase FadM